MFCLLLELLEQLHNFPRQLICTKHHAPHLLKMWSSFRWTYALQNLMIQYYIHYLTKKKFPKEKAWEEGCQHRVLHYYGLLHCGGSDSTTPGWFDQWLCGCVVSNLKVSNFQNEANKFLKNLSRLYEPDWALSNGENSNRGIRKKSSQIEELHKFSQILSHIRNLTKKLLLCDLCII